MTINTVYLFTSTYSQTKDKINLDDKKWTQDLMNEIKFWEIF